jgi:hypothetical protein
MGTGNGALSANGNFDIVAGNTLVSITALAFETIGPQPMITGSVYLNGRFVGRIPILDIVKANPLGAPLSAGMLRVTGIPATLSAGMVEILAKVFNVAVPPQTLAGLVSINIGLAPL